MKVKIPNSRYPHQLFLRFYSLINLDESESFPFTKRETIYNPLSRLEMFAVTEGEADETCKTLSLVPVKLLMITVATLFKSSRFVDMVTCPFVGLGVQLIIL